MAGIGNIGSSSIGGTYIQALRPRGIEQTFSVKDDLKVKYFRDSYERSSVQIRWAQFQGGEGWKGVASGPIGQPYCPWHPHRSS